MLLLWSVKVMVAEKEISIMQYWLTSQVVE